MYNKYYIFTSRYFKLKFQPYFLIASWIMQNYYVIDQFIKWSLDLYIKHRLVTLQGQPLLGELDLIFL